ncbi:hypothetical protein E2C01_036597 [Portunus trituberculatus]|uniref:Uncharacterized protein n=1 Tax=Portunus trituberculatus TaxID=210409 RepID=A0A5B7F939_PORTR|nr:hypothetical protein [Portunus trituberculatus]
MHDSISPLSHPAFPEIFPQPLFFRLIQSAPSLLFLLHDQRPSLSCVTYLEATLTGGHGTALGNMNSPHCQSASHSNITRHCSLVTVKPASLDLLA